MRQAITFDFHNTLIRCDAWFDLEVKMLPSQVAKSLVATGDLTQDSVSDQELNVRYRALRAEIITHGHELTAVEGVQETFRRTGICMPVDKIEPIVHSLFHELVGQSAIVEGACTTLSHLHRQGYLIGIVSSAVHHDFLEWTLTHHDLRRYLSVVVTSASSGYYKSRPEIYRHAFEKLDAPLSRSVHVGDSFKFDHLGGLAAGLQTVWLNEHGHTHPRESPSPTLTLPSLVDAGPQIQSLLEEIADAG